MPADTDAHDAAPPARRLVLLGASNLSLGFPEALAHARAAWPGPLEVLAAHGLGRSYGIPSSFLARTLPGIEACGLWSALERLPPRPTTAFLTDAGNDVAYGVPVERTLGWIRAAVDRLEHGGARITLARLPLASLERVSPLRFDVVRTLLFRARPITLEGVREHAAALDRGLCALARERGLALLTPRTEWYGWDRIHLRARARSAYWRAAFASCGSEIATPPDPLSAPERRRLRRLRPEHETRLGRERRAPQPAGRLDDGSTIALY